MELEYVVAHRGTRGQSFVYELVYDGQGATGQPFLMGLIDPDQLDAASGYDRKFAGAAPEFAAPPAGFAGSSRPHSGPKAAGSRTPPSDPEPALDRGFNGKTRANTRNAVLDEPTPNIGSYAKTAASTTPTKAPGAA